MEMCAFNLTGAVFLCDAENQRNFRKDAQKMRFLKIH